MGTCFPVMTSVILSVCDFFVRASQICIDTRVARDSRPSLEDAPGVYVALLAMNVFQTTLAAVTYDDRDWKKLGIVLDHVGDLIYRHEAERIFEWVCRQGVVVRMIDQAGEPDGSDVDRIEALQDIVLDYGRGLYKMAVVHARTNPHFSMNSLRKRLVKDARTAFGVKVNQWLTTTDVDRAPLIPDVRFVSSPDPDLHFKFKS